VQGWETERGRGVEGVREQGWRGGDSLVHNELRLAFLLWSVREKKSGVAPGDYEMERRVSLARSRHFGGYGRARAGVLFRRRLGELPGRGIRCLATERGENGLQEGNK
jgi:hypothetical protein